MQRISMFFFCLISTIISLLTACAPHEDLVSLSTVEEVMPYVQETYGGADLLSSSITENERTYYFKDNVYGFEYYVRCSRESVGLDSTVMGYREVIRSNHDAQYLRTLWSKLDFSGLAECVTTEFNTNAGNTDTPIVGYVIVPSKIDSDDAMRASMYLGTQLYNLDSRRRLPSYMLFVRDAYGNGIGYFDFDGNKNISDEHANRSMFYRQAQEIMRKEEIEMFESERVLFSEVPGLSDEQLARETDTSNAVIILYRFRYEHKWYFIADIKVMYGQIPRYYIYNVTDEHSMVKTLTRKSI